MKRILIAVIILLALCSCGTTNHLAFYQPQKHKLVKRMSPNQVRKASQGYAFRNGKIARKAR